LQLAAENKSNFRSTII